MHDEPNKPRLTAELAAFEQQLADLAPTTPRIDRDRLMYDAGRAAALAPSQPTQLGRNFWQFTTALATAASLLLAVTLLWQPNHPQTAKVAPAVETTAAISTPRLDSRTHRDRLPPDYLGMRNVALTEGISVFDRGARSAGITSEDAAPPANSRQLLKELLPAPEHPSS
jgi:hypothetical protein